MGLEDLTQLEKDFIVGAGMLASLPLAAVIVYSGTSIYSGIKSAGQTIFYNPEQQKFKELYKKNFEKAFD